MTLYFANPCNNQNVMAAMSQGLIGYISTPAQRNFLPADVVWCADNGCFGKGFPGVAGWLEWLETRPYQDNCWFATAPDVVGDAAATMERSLPLLPLIRERGYPAALVAQDGIFDVDIPWDEFDWLFIGGTTDFKLSPDTQLLVKEAKSRQKKVHMGRVNSFKRYKLASEWGCDSVDGTYLRFGPDTNLPKLLSWVKRIRESVGIPEWTVCC